MALNIKDHETDQLAREVARLAGVPITTAVRDALQDRLALLRSRGRAPEPSLSDIIARGRARAILDDRSESEILGYDADGLPG